MADYPRLFEPDTVSPLWLPGTLKSISQAGIVEVRSVQQIGWRWTEQYSLASPRDANVRALMAYIRNIWRNGTIFTITHPLSPGSGLARNGAGSGTITVDGASQTGSTLATTGWGNNVTDCVAAGDLISVENRVYEVSANANSDGVGDCVIPVTPNVYSSPANGASVTISAVEFRAILMNMPEFPQNTSPDYYSFQVSFQEIVPK